MTSTVLAISAAYVVIGVLLLDHRPDLALCLVGEGGGDRRHLGVLRRGVLRHQGPARLAARAGQLPARFQLLWVRVVEPDAKIGDRGAIYLWIEEVDEHNVPDGVPRSYRLPYSRPLADRPPRRATRSCAAGRSRAWPRTSKGVTARSPRTSTRTRRRPEPAPTPGRPRSTSSSSSCCSRRSASSSAPDAAGPTLPPKGP